MTYDLMDLYESLDELTEIFESYRNEHSDFYNSFARLKKAVKSRAFKEILEEEEE